ncbi:hypothetical protein [Archangium violaceum]|uniref:hypothetical protein n=1 Tax=Archangium violaceum TaxID=83451 RepID=UPI0037C1ABD4
MRGRVLVAVLAGLLLSAPLMALLVSNWLMPLTRFSSTREKAVPMLSWEQRRQLSTWRQPCRRSNDCESPLACVFDKKVQGLYCADSECVTDSQCGEGFACRAMSTWGGEFLKRCALEGDRQEGEGCELLSGTHASACAPGLFCKGWCGRPCQPEVPGSCPEGFFCPREGGPDGPSCLPSCEARGCPPGQACIRFSEGASVCAVVHGTNCQQSPCPEAHVCETRTLPDRAGTVWMRCEAPCSNNGVSCPEGSFCRSRRCVRACHPDSPGTCGPGEKCEPLHDSTRWACVFDHEV